MRLAWIFDVASRVESRNGCDAFSSLAAARVTGTNSAPTALKLSWKYRINALSLALRYPNTEMAHAVYECVCKDESDMKWEREREAKRDVEIRGSEDWKRLNEDCKRHFDQFLSSSRQRWTTGLFPVVAPYILSDAKFYFDEVGSGNEEAVSKWGSGVLTACQRKSCVDR